MCQHGPKSFGEWARAFSQASGSGSADNGAKNNTYVSKYYTLKDGEIEKFLRREGLTHRRSGNEFNLKNCPTCPPTKGQEDNFYKLYVSSENGAYFCHRCGGNGSWFDLKSHFRGMGKSESSGSDFSISKFKAEASAANVAKPDLKVVDMYPADLLRRNKYPEVLEYLVAERGIDMHTLWCYGVGAATFTFGTKDGNWKKQPCVTFPWLVSTDNNKSWTICRVKARSLWEKHKQRLIPKGGGWGFFGWHTVPEKATSVVLTGGRI